MKKPEQMDNRELAGALLGLAELLDKSREEDMGDLVAVAAKRLLGVEAEPAAASTKDAEEILGALEGIRDGLKSGVLPLHHMAVAKSAAQRIRKASKGDAQ